MYRKVSLRHWMDREIYLRKWLPEGKPKGIIQIAHGMTEHAGVYTDFILRY